MVKLLLAEDEPVLRMLIIETLEDEGYQIDVACDGEEAFALASTNRYDLIILDNMMPKLTGIDVITRLRLLPPDAQSKILMLSAKSQQAEQEKALAAGADAFVTKPFSPMELVVKVGEMVNG